ncbi:glycine cleavage system protein R [Sphingomonas oryzagri]|uniref:ACT domain-containing protein n=1 Tax=Sphingomonas oryzagri TaxID=3042314 RepID=A0ABT6N1Y3_9SPHN|nr:ACT domain-containing protein [Sphingomonas oryzagri]MDH7639295.1 ACT domain-containing protein [Sphingomonas oryzagri]
MNQTIILTVIGSDRPGLTRAIADAVFEAGGNWLESHLSRLGAKYVGSILIDLPAERLADLETATRRIDAVGLKVELVAPVETSEREGHRLAIEIVGQDRPGIVRTVTTVLAGLEVNIEAFTTSIEGSAWSGAPLFRAKAELLLPAALALREVREALENISGEIMVDFAAESTVA